MTTTKSEVCKLIASSAEKIRQQGETSAQAFTRYITKTDEGRKLFAIHKRATGSDYIPPAEQVQKIAAPSTPSLRRLQKLGDEVRKANPTLSVEQAFAEAYADPSNREIVMLEKRERLSAA